MKRLLIVGNGFDKAHKVKCDYCDFKKYLLKNYGPSKFATLEVYQDKDGEICISEKNVLSILLNHFNGLMDCSWGGFENELALFDFEEYIGSKDFYFSEDDDSSDFHYQYLLEDFDNIVYLLYKKISDLFLEWIKIVNEETDFEKISSIENLLNKEDLKVLSFNYTMFIEDNYEKDVLHIHNCVYDEQIVIGHGETVVESDITFNVSDINDNMRRYFKKRTDDIINKHCYFFNEIDQNTKEVYSYGFGYSKPDIPYIQYILNKIPNDCIWYLNAYDESEAEEQKDLLFRLGFRGEVKFFY